MKNLLFLFSAILISISAFAQPGSLDNNFDADGLKMIDLSGSDLGYDIAVQDDGMILICGTTTANPTLDIVVIRLQPDGSFDNSFGISGIATINFNDGLDNVRALAIQSDGKIVIVGSTGNDAAIARLNVDGSLDNTFSFDGMLTLPIGTSVDNGNNVVIMPDGKIVVVGGAWEGSGFNVAVVRLNPDGSLDNTFSFDGMLTTDINGSSDAAFDVYVDATGKVTIGGYTNDIITKPLLLRYNSDGTLDNSFGSNGEVVVDLGSEAGSFLGIAVIGSGEILAAGKIGSGDQSEFLIARFLPDGSLDNSFSFDGLAGSDVFGDEDQAFDLLVQPDGKILSCGYASNPDRNMALLRLNEDGTPDSGFGTNGIVTNHPTSFDHLSAIALQPDGKIVATGSAGSPERDIVVARYISGINIGIGEVDVYLGSTLIYPNPILNNNVVIEYELMEARSVSIELFDLTGKRIAILQSEKKESVGEYQKTLNLPTLSKGNYLIRLNTENGAVSVKVVVGN